MTGRAVTSYAYLADVENADTFNNTLKTSEIMPQDKNIYTPIQVATTVSFMVGIIQVNAQNNFLI